MNQEAEQLAAVIDEIRRRVRARHADGVVLGDIPLTDLTPLLRARDAAEAKVAAIGSVNPRPAGLKNSIIQFVKRQIARALDWHVREQIEFNRAVLICVQSALEALHENNRTFRELATEHDRALKAMANEHTRAFNELSDQTNRTFNELSDQTNRTFKEHFSQNDRAFNDLANQHAHALNELSDQTNRTFKELFNQNDRAFNDLANQHARALQELTDERNSTLRELAGENHRTLKDLVGRIELLGQTESSLRSEVQDLRAESEELKDLRTHWHAWREAWERKLSENEIHFLRGLADLQASSHHRVTLMDQHYREKLDAQHADFHAELARYSREIQTRLWRDLSAQHDALVNAELRVIRQKLSFMPASTQLAATVSASPAAAPAGPIAIDWLRFADRFRGSEESIKQRQQLYAERFAGQSGVLDLGCGRGEMLEVLREAGISARGVDLHEESLALCAAKGLEVEKADLFQYLDSLPDSSLGGVICAQVVEHLPPERLPDLVRLIHAKLRRDALVAIETPNPECLAIFATHFFLDPTHQRPVPSPLLSFYLEESGFGVIEIVRLSPAVDSMPSLARLPKAVREDFFGALDYTAFARKL